MKNYFEIQFIVIIYANFIIIQFGHLWYFANFDHTKVITLYIFIDVGGSNII
jgi:hypothetical protein